MEADNWVLEVVGMEKKVPYFPKVGNLLMYDLYYVIFLLPFPKKESSFQVPRDVAFW